MRLGAKRDHVLSLRALETKCDVFRANLERISVGPGQALKARQTQNRLGAPRTLGS